jgi:hypothetical protein
VINLGEEFLRLRSELVLEEQRVAVNGLSELALRKRKREELRRRRTSLEREVRILHQRFRRLPAPLDLARIRWAQSVLTCPNGRILIVDIALSAEEAGIVHVLLLDFGGTVCLDRDIAPGCILSKQAMRDLGMTTSVTVCFRGAHATARRQALLGFHHPANSSGIRCQSLSTAPPLIAPGDSYTYLKRWLRALLE